MNTENRKYPRFCPKKLIASISIDPPHPAKKISIKGDVVDMSHTGIKIKLTTPLNIDIHESIMLINLTLPESGVPVAIRGKIKHLTNESEYGLQYLEPHLDHGADDLMFECIKAARPS